MCIILIQDKFNAFESSNTLRQTQVELKYKLNVTVNFVLNMTPCQGSRQCHVQTIANRTFQNQNRQQSHDFRQSSIPGY